MKLSARRTDDSEKCAGIGGTITTLLLLFRSVCVNMTAMKSKKAVLNKSEVEQLIVGLSSMGAERKTKPAAQREHDVIMYGAAVLAHAMERSGLKRFMPVIVTVWTDTCSM